MTGQTVASRTFIERGGTEAEYEIYKALFSTGRKEPDDFVFRPSESTDLSFLVAFPNVGLKIGDANTAERLLMDSIATLADVKYIDEQRALSDGRGALSEALGG